MPTYEYQCGACGNEFEELLKFSDPDPVECPKCGKPEVTKKISLPSFALKGDGWYKDLYGGPKATEDKVNKDKPDSANKDSGKKESTGGEKAPSADKPAASSGSSDSAKKSEKSSNTAA